MNDIFSRFGQAPASLKKSFGMLVAAWVCHPIYIYAFFYINQATAEARDVLIRMLVVSVCLAILLLLIKRWARALVVMGNCFIVVYDIFVLAVSPPNKILGALCAGVTLFTIVGTYWLFSKDSRDYFNKVNPEQEPRDALNPPKNPDRR
jgi:hypothetical protein